MRDSDRTDEPSTEVKLVYRDTEDLMSTFMPALELEPADYDTLRFQSMMYSSENEECYIHIGKNYIKFESEWLEIYLLATKRDENPNNPAMNLVDIAVHIYQPAPMRHLNFSAGTERKRTLKTSTGKSVDYYPLDKDRLEEIAYALNYAAKEVHQHQRMPDLALMMPPFAPEPVKSPTPLNPKRTSARRISQLRP